MAISGKEPESRLTRAIDRITALLTNTKKSKSLSSTSDQTPASTDTLGSTLRLTKARDRLIDLSKQSKSVPQELPKVSIKQDAIKISTESSDIQRPNGMRTIKPHDVPIIKPIITAERHGLAKLRHSQVPTRLVYQDGRAKRIPVTPDSMLPAPTRNVDNADKNSDKTLRASKAADVLGPNTQKIQEERSQSTATRSSARFK